MGQKTFDLVEATTVDLDGHDIHSRPVNGKFLLEWRTRDDGLMQASGNAFYVLRRDSLKESLYRYAAIGPLGRNTVKSCENAVTADNVLYYIP